MIAKLKRFVDKHVAKDGRAVMGVFPEPEIGKRAFSYSIGNAKRGLPELLVIGLCGPDGMWLINAMSKLMLQRGRKFDDGEMVDLGGLCPVCVVDASGAVRDEYTIQAGQWLGREDYPVQQIVMPDKTGRLPWHSGCAEPYRNIPVLRAGAMN